MIGHGCIRGLRVLTVWGVFIDENRTYSACLKSWTQISIADHISIQRHVMMSPGVSAKVTAGINDRGSMIPCHRSGHLTLALAAFGTRPPSLSHRSPPSPAPASSPRAVEPALGPGPSATRAVKSVRACQKLASIRLRLLSIPAYHATPAPSPLHFFSLLITNSKVPRDRLYNDDSRSRRQRGGT